MQNWTAGDDFKYVTPSATHRGKVVAVGGGFVVGALAAVFIERIDGEEFQRVGPPSTTPVVLPADAIEAVS